MLFYINDYVCMQKLMICYVPLNNYPELPQPPPSFLNHGINNLIIEETSYNITELEVEHRNLLQNCNEEQRFVYQHILDSIQKSEGGLFLFMAMVVVGKPICGEL